MTMMIVKRPKLHLAMSIGSDNMEMLVPDINEIWEEILSEKIIKKNRQYGNSVYDTDTIFSSVGDPEELIKIRLDDKMRRLKTLDPESPKYDSELMEIIAYIIHLLNWRRNSDRDNSRYEGDQKSSADYLRELCDSHLPTLGLRRLPNKQRRHLREEDFQ